MNSRDYWERRAAQDMYDRMGAAEETAAEMNAAIQQTSAYLEKEVKAVMRGMQSFGISETEAKKILNAAGDGTALQRLRKAAQQVGDPEKREALLNAINSAGAYRYRITRIEELNRDINRQCRELYKTENRHITSALRNVAEDSYYHEIFSIQKGTGLGFSFSKFPRQDVDRILRANWSGGNYSQRIWKDVSGMTARLKNELLVSMLSGRSNEKTARIFQEQFGVNAFCARRIVRTESAYVANAAQAKAYGEAGIERYRFVATLDSRTCECCAALDGKVFDLAKAKPGTNYPPMHPFCRSTTIADFGDEELAGLERRAKDKDGNTVRVPAGMTYEDWYESLDSVDGRKMVLKSKPGKADNVETALDIVNSAEYKAKFSSHYDNPKVAETVTDCCRKILKNRSGTKYEEMFAIDSRTGKILTYIKGKNVNGISTTETLQKLLTNSPKSSIIIVHNHPNSATFSKQDINTALKYRSIAETVAAGHDGTVYFAGNVFGHNNAIRDYTVAYTKHLRTMNDFEARNAAWESVAENLGFVYERR